MEDEFSALPQPQTRYRLGVLVTDHDPVPPFTQAGGYFSAYYDLFTAACSTLWPYNQMEELYDIYAYDVVSENRSYPASSDVDAILITGSSASAYDDEPWIIQLVEYVRFMYFSPLSESFGILGSCFGHQIIARALGYVVAPNPNGWETGVETVQLTPMGRQVLGLHELRIHQMHQDIVITPPQPPVMNLGSSPKCHVQFIYVPERILAVQGHPEFVTWIVLATLNMLHEKGKLNDKQLKEARRRAIKEHDGVAVGISFAIFIHACRMEKERLLQAQATSTTGW